ncbi:MAG: DUF5131 family protein [Clostridia bacterium]|nr:DUF5131 family protein [Clostridia bacterium]
MSDIWNPWHGCRRYSDGCRNCYVYRRDESIGVDASKVRKTAAFDLPVRRKRGGGYSVPPQSALFLCMTSDFFIEEADEWRGDIWRMIRLRRDVFFTVITKRIARLPACLPPDWGGGWDNFRLICTMENQREADNRLPLLLDAPIKHKGIACEPLLSPVRFNPPLDDRIEIVVAGGESGVNARPCRYEWILDIREQCKNAGVSFWFKQTGANFIKDGREYKIPRRLQHEQAKKANINLD